MDISKYLIHTAVLWVKSGINSYSEITFVAGVEIAVRWEIRQENFIGNNGRNLVSKALVHVNQDIIPDSFLYLGELIDLSAEQIVNPKLLDTAFAIKAFRKASSVSGNYILRKVYLYGRDVSRD